MLTDTLWAALALTFAWVAGKLFARHPDFIGMSWWWVALPLLCWAIVWALYGLWFLSQSLRPRK